MSDQQAASSSGRGEGGHDRDVPYKARRYAVKFSPPCIFLEYEDGHSKRRVRAVKLNGVQPGIDVDRLTKKVIRSFPRRLEPTSVKFDQVRKLVVRLVESLALQQGGSYQQAGTISASSPLPTLHESAPHNGKCTDSRTELSPPRLIAALSPKLEPPSRGFSNSGMSQYGSVESGLSRFTTSSAGDSGDDDLLSALDELDREMSGVPATPPRGPALGHTSSVHPSNGPSESTSRDSSFSFKDRNASGGLSASSSKAVLPSVPALSGPAGSLDAPTPSTPPTTTAKSRFAMEAEKLVIGLDVKDDTDLNKVTDVELKMVKTIMETDFRKNQLKPGDPGYEYDKQIEFGPAKEKNEWDDSDDDAEVSVSEEPDIDWQDIQKAVARTSNSGAGA